MKIKEKAIEILKFGYVCDNCLGRQFSQLLSGFSNKERGKIFRNFIAMAIDSGEKINVDLSNFYEIKFLNERIKSEKPKKCIICKGFFEEKIEKIAEKIVKKIKKYEFNTFLIGSILSDELLKAEEELWKKVGIEFCETIKSEINRELGKIVKRKLKKKFETKNPDITIIVNLKKNKIKVEIRSLYILGEYKKIVRGIPQTKWTCKYCKGKGCKYCNWKGKMYPTSVQEIIEKPFLKLTKGEKTKFHGAGREDIDARCLDYRPFVIEVVKPIKRKINLKQIEKEINKSKKVKVRKLKFTTKKTIRKIKTVRLDKTYFAEVWFENDIEKDKLKKLKSLANTQILQKTPLRVLHRRTNKLRKRKVKEISWKIVGRKKLELKIKAESGLYIKELITGDEGRTKPSVVQILNNKVKKINLDVIKIHKKGEKFG